MPLSYRKNGRTSLFKEVRAFKVWMRKIPTKKKTIIGAQYDFRAGHQSEIRTYPDQTWDSTFPLHLKAQFGNPKDQDPFVLKTNRAAKGSVLLPPLLLFYPYRFAATFPKENRFQNAIAVVNCFRVANCYRRSGLLFVVFLVLRGPLGTRSFYMRSDAETAQMSVKERQRKSAKPRVCKRWFPNGGSSSVGERNSATPFIPQFYLITTTF